MSQIVSQRDAVLRASPTLPGWLALLIALTAYFLTAKIGLLLSLPTGFSSPLWPAAGVAFLLAQRLGHHALVGVALGSLLSNITAGANGASVLTWPDFDAPLMPLLCLGVGAAAQAGLGVWLVARLLRQTPAGAFRVWVLLRILFRAGPLACLINAGVAMLVLPTLAGAAWPDRLPVGLVWWVGDALGVLGLMPVVLFLQRNPRAAPHERPLLTAMPVLAAVAIGLLSWLTTVALGRLQTDTINSRESAQIAELRHHLQWHVDRSILMLETFRAFYEASEVVSATEFERFSRPWLESDDAVSAVGWAPLIRADARSAYETQAPGILTPVSITERGPRNELVPARPHIDHWPLTLVEPAQHSKVRGFDISSEPTRNKALQRALQQDSPSASGPIELAGEFGNQNVSILLLQKLYSEPPAVLAAAIRLNRLVEHEIKLFDSTLPAGTRVRLLDSQHQALLDHQLTAEGTLIKASTRPLPSGLHTRTPLLVADRDLQLEVILPPQNMALLGSLSWWLGQVMPQLFAVVLGIALVNGALRQGHTQKLQDDLGQLIEHHAQPDSRQPLAHGQHDSTFAAAWVQQLWQPQFIAIVDLENGLLSAVDCRPHWPDAPADMQEVDALSWAERSGNAADFSRQLIQSVLTQSKGWPLRRGDAFSFGLGVSSQALVTPGWAEAVLEQLAAHRLPGCRLSIDLREDCLTTASASATALEALGRLRDAGVRVSLSGFGTGRTALSALRRLPVDRIRLDHSLVRDVSRDPTARAIVHTLAQLATTLDIEVLASGVDDVETAHILRSLGCHTAQGKLFPAPWTAEAVAQVLVGNRALWLPS